MPTVTTTVSIPGVGRDQVWPVVTDPRSYARLAGHVLAIDPDTDRDDRYHWALLLNGSRVEWVQQDHPRPPGRLEFEQISGDFEQLRGVWSLHPTAAGTDVELALGFHLGIDGLAPLLDPIWGQSFQAHTDALVRAVHQAVTRETVPGERR